MINIGTMEDKAGQTGRVASEQVLIFISGLNSGAKKRQESITITAHKTALSHLKGLHG